MATDEKSVVDGNFYTAQSENFVWTMMPQVIEALKNKGILMSPNVEISYIWATIPKNRNNEIQF